MYSTRWPFDEKKGVSIETCRILVSNHFLATLLKIPEYKPQKFAKE